MDLKRKCICIGHRGAAGHQPENTLASFEFACQLGVDYIELDVWFSDGEVICIHDETLDRTTSGTGAHRILPHTTLKTLDAGRGQQIPTLKEVIQAVRGRSKIMIEFKDAQALQPCLKLLQELAQKGAIQAEDFVLQSFDLEIVRRALDLAEEFPRACLFKNPSVQDVQSALELKAQAIHVNFEKLSTAVIQAAQHAGLKVYIYTVNQPEQIRCALAQGVDGITSDYPDRVIALST